MNKSLCTAAILAVLTLSGCASNQIFQPIIDSHQSPTMASGYLAGMFSRNWTSGKTNFGVGIVNTATAREYVMPFGIERTLPKDIVDEIAMIQLPPGKYRIAYWIQFSTSGQEQIARGDIPADSIDSLPFTLASGEVVFIGSYVARKEQGNNPEARMGVHHQRLTLQTARNSLLNRYPAFATQVMSCPSCLE